MRYSSCFIVSKLKLQTSAHNYSKYICGLIFQNSNDHRDSYIHNNPAQINIQSCLDEESVLSLQASFRSYRIVELQCRWCRANMRCIVRLAFRLQIACGLKVQTIE